MSEHTIQQFFQAIWSIHSQMRVVRDAIGNEKVSFAGDDRTFLECAESLMNAYLVAIQGPLNDCIDRHHPPTREQLEAEGPGDPPWGGSGCESQ